MPDILKPAGVVCESKLRQALTVQLSEEMKKDCCVSYSHAVRIELLSLCLSALRCLYDPTQLQS